MQGQVGERVRECGCEGWGNERMRECGCEGWESEGGNKSERGSKGREGGREVVSKGGVAGLRSSPRPTLASECVAGGWWLSNFRTAGRNSVLYCL